MLEPVIKETYLGRAQVRKIFRIPKVGVIAGCYVQDGKIMRNAEVKVLRNKEVVFKGRIASLKHLKENVTEVKKDLECGIGLDKFKDFQEGDLIEAFITEKVYQSEPSDWRSAHGHRLSRTRHPFPHARSLKDKRKELAGLKDRIRQKHNVALAELDFQDVWQRTKIGIVTLNSQPTIVEQILARIRSDVFEHVNGELLGSRIEFF